MLTLFLKITPTQAKDILNCRYLRLTNGNLEHLTDVLKQSGEEELVQESIHYIEKLKI